MVALEGSKKVVQLRKRKGYEEIHEKLVHGWLSMRTTDHFTPLLDVRSILVAMGELWLPRPGATISYGTIADSCQRKGGSRIVERPVRLC